MKNSIGVLSVSKFYHSAVKAELKRRGFQKNTAKKIIKTHKEIMNRATRYSEMDFVLRLYSGK